MLSKLAPFEYTSLDTDTCSFVWQKAQAIHTRLKRTAEDIIAIGQDLIEVKARLEHGLFLAWLQTEFAMSERHARNFMHVAERFGAKTEIIADLSVTVIYELAAPSTPDTVIEQVESGQIPATLPEIRAAKDREIERLRNGVKLLQEQEQTSLAKIRRFETRDRWEDKIIRTPSDDLSDRDKLVALKLPGVLEKARNRATADDACDDGLVRVYMDDLARETGKSTKTVGTSLKNLAEMGAIKRECKPGYSKEAGRPDNAVYIGLAEPLKKAEIKAVVPRSRGHNQKHFMCPECKDTHTKAIRIYQVTCIDCGVVSHLNPQNDQHRAFILDEEELARFNEWQVEIADDDSEEDKEE